MKTIVSKEKSVRWDENYFDCVLQDVSGMITHETLHISEVKYLEMLSQLQHQFHISDHMINLMDQTIKNYLDYKTQKV